MEEKVKKTKTARLTAEQLKNLNSQMHFMSVLIMRLYYHNHTVLPVEEAEMVEKFLDWYCKEFKYRIKDGKFVSDEAPISDRHN